MQKLIGIGVVVICVFGGFALAQGRLLALWQPAEMLIILGAVAGSMAIGNSKKVLLAMWQQLRQIFRSPRENDSELYRQLLLLMYKLLEEAKSKGLKALDEHIEAPLQSSFFLSHPLVLENELLVGFITDNFRMLSMGKTSPHELETLLEQELMALEDDLLKPAHSLAETAEACPGFGILAAVMGIIITMQKIDGPLTGIGVHVAAALVGTFIGIFLCYCLLAPAAAAMTQLVKRQIGMLECVKSILVAHVRGRLPLLAVDAGRKIIEQAYKPGFTALESWIIEGSNASAGAAESIPFANNRAA